MTHISIRRLLPALALVVAALASAPASAGPFNSFVVFGDSLSDNGNNAAAGLYDPSQVVTGNTYVPASTYARRHVQQRAGVGERLRGDDRPAARAFARRRHQLRVRRRRHGNPGPGAGGYPFSLLVQSTQYLAATGNHASPNGLYVIAGGGNDARAALTAIGGGASIPGDDPGDGRLVRRQRRLDRRRAASRRRPAHHRLGRAEPRPRAGT